MDWRDVRAVLGRCLLAIAIVTVIAAFQGAAECWQVQQRLSPDTLAALRIAMGVSFIGGPMLIGFLAYTLALRRWYQPPRNRRRERRVLLVPTDLIFGALVGAGGAVCALVAMIATALGAWWIAPSFFS
ncbi:MAG: hypothetical protein U0625_00890 [Phycisphaerales bacterium]